MSSRNFHCECIWGCAANSHICCTLKTRICGAIASKTRPQNEFGWQCSATDYVTIDVNFHTHNYSSHHRFYETWTAIANRCKQTLNTHIRRKSQLLWTMTETVTFSCCCCYCYFIFQMTSRVERTEFRRKMKQNESNRIVNRYLANGQSPCYLLTCLRTKNTCTQTHSLHNPHELCWKWIFTICFCLFSIF